MSRAALRVAAVVAFLQAPAARAHEVLHAVELDRAVAVRAYFADGEGLAYVQYEVYSPADPRIPHQQGRTDRSGWLAFVPDTGGKWRVKVADAAGHGLDVEVDAAARGVTAGASPGPSAAAFVLRPLAGIAAIAAVFLVLFRVYRRKGTPR